MCNCASWLHLAVSSRVRFVCGVHFSASVAPWQNGMSGVRSTDVAVPCCCRIVGWLLSLIGFIIIAVYKGAQSPGCITRSDAWVLLTACLIFYEQFACSPGS